MRRVPSDATEPFPTRIDATVERIRVFGGRATGVQLMTGEVITATEIIVCAGAIETPRILLRSGLGLDGIGADLQDHPSVALDAPVAARHDLPLVTGAARLASDPAIQVMPMESGEVLVALMEPLARGSVTADRIDTARLAHPVDRHRLVAGVKEVGDRLGVAVDLDRDGHYVHACGSCRSVVTRHGRVVGVDALWICDASALPAMPSAGPYLTVLAMAERFADRWLRGQC
jgi:choline dehydrogenase